MLCKHDWIIIDKTVLESPFEQMAKSRITKFSADSISVDMYAKKVCYVFKCKKCLKIKRESESS